MDAISIDRIAQELLVAGLIKFSKERAQAKRDKRKARNLKNKANKGFREVPPNNREGGPRNGRRKDA